mgnify:CR=1 FL=1
MFFSSAPGRTVDAVEVWGNQVDYLQSVESPEGEEVPNYHSQAVFSADQVRAAVLAAYPGADLSGDPSVWFGAPAVNEGGTVSSILVGGVTLTGGQVRTLFDLRSACFTVAWDGTNFTFSVTGYGHGVGMSQYGANAMAKAGSSFEEILTWYVHRHPGGPAVVNSPRTENRRSSSLRRFLRYSALLFKDGAAAAAGDGDLSLALGYPELLTAARAAEIAVLLVPVHGAAEVEPVDGRSGQLHKLGVLRPPAGEIAGQHSKKSPDDHNERQPVQGEENWSR